MPPSKPVNVFREFTDDELHDYLHQVVRKARESKLDDYSVVAELVEEQVAYLTLDA